MRVKREKSKIRKDHSQHTLIGERPDYILLKGSDPITRVLVCPFFVSGFDHQIGFNHYHRYAKPIRGNVIKYGNALCINGHRLVRPKTNRILFANKSFPKIEIRN